MTKETVLERLAKEVLGSEKEFFDEHFLNEFAEWHIGLNPKDSISGHAIVIAFLYFCEFKKGIENLRRCTICGKLMNDGYVKSNGERFYCSLICLNEDYSSLHDWSVEMERDETSGFYKNGEITNLVYSEKCKK